MVALHRPLDAACLEQFHFSGPLQMVPIEDANAPEGAVAFQNGINKVTVTTNNPVTVPVLRALADAWPCSLTFDELAPAEENRQQVRELLLTFYGRCNNRQRHRNGQRCSCKEFSYFHT